MKTKPEQTNRRTRSDRFSFCLGFVYGYRNTEGATLRSVTNENRKSGSSEKEDRYYTTRGSAGMDDNGKVSVEGGGGGDDRGLVWPKLYISLSSKEKEEDFMAMKGCKLPQRPKKRAKIIQRSLLVSFLFSSSFFQFPILLFFWEFGVFEGVWFEIWFLHAVGESRGMVVWYVSREVWGEGEEDF